MLPVATCDLNLTTSDKGILSAVPFLGIICRYVESSVFFCVHHLFLGGGGKVIEQTDDYLAITYLESSRFQKFNLVGLFYLYSSHLWGFLADTKGRRRVIRPTLFVAFMISIVSSFAPNFYQFAILRFFNGFL